MIEGILIGLTTALTIQNILMVMVGCFFGTIIGMLPGLGPMTAIALMIRRPPRSTQGVSSAASDVYKRQYLYLLQLFMELQF